MPSSIGISAAFSSFYRGIKPNNQIIRTNIFVKGFY
jgi:hypothetical protein